MSALLPKLALRAASSYAGATEVPARMRDELRLLAAAVEAFRCAREPDRDGEALGRVVIAARDRTLEALASSATIGSKSSPSTAPRAKPSRRARACAFSPSITRTSRRRAISVSRRRAAMSSHFSATARSPSRTGSSACLRPTPVPRSSPSAAPSAAAPGSMSRRPSATVSAIRAPGSERHIPQPRRREFFHAPRRPARHRRLRRGLRLRLRRGRPQPAPARFRHEMRRGARCRGPWRRRRRAE